MGGTFTKCCKSQPSYARYSNSKENEAELENVVGSILEMDPSLHDRDDGVHKLNLWIDEITQDVQMTGPQLEISRWKCIKYWEAQHVSDIYSKDHGIGLKLTGSCVRFYFQGSHQDVAPRLVIEHCGKSLQMKGSNPNSVPMWIKSIKNRKWNPFQKPVERHGSFAIHNNDHTTEMLTTRYG